MKSRVIFFIGASTVLMFAISSQAETKTFADHNPNEYATPDFKFKNVPSPSKSDAATKARFTIVDGRRDRNGGTIDKLCDGKIPTEEDQPSENFFFNAGTEGGRLLVDLRGTIDIKQINTYSWHPNIRGPQVYKLYASTGKDDNFNPQPKRGTDPMTCGWKLVARIDTRPKERPGGGQYGVSIRDSNGIIGKYHYLLFDISLTERTDPFGNTFYSEIDVVEPNAPVVAASQATKQYGETFEAERGKYRITIYTSETPDLTEWAHKELAPVLQQWYPKIVKMLPSEGYQAPSRVSITFSPNMRGVAAASGTGVRCGAGWFRRQLQGEANGAVVHELVHVVQQYGLARRTNPNATRTPGWLVEGIADYIRWFLYEPQTRGAEVTKRNIARARYNSSYRITGNFLNWVTETYDKDIVRKLNAAARQGKYNEELWKEATGHTVQELGDEWKRSLEKKIAAETAAGGLYTLYATGYGLAQP
ncbi:MAG TPA: basic secretory protein-like protein [Sedimentisphaerales bacterium]|nr:basic secretory protein-like protein [Sedimentisphaerales bacterium]